MLGIIGGSGLYDIPGLRDTRWETVESPWGAPSDQLLFGTLDDRPLVFLPRHGRGHVHSPTQVNYRANIDALKRAGATDVLSMSACGSLREGLAPGTFVIVDQFVDHTVGRERTFFPTGLVAHVSLAHPVCARLGDALERAAAEAGIPAIRGGTYIAIEGPQFSTAAESNLYRAWGCDVIGMTNMPEARLAREAELCYATVAMVTDYDCWHADHGAVDVAMVLRVLLDNAEKARRLVAAAAPRLAGHPEPCPHGCDRVLDVALITSHEKRDAEAVRMVEAIAGRVLARKLD